MRHGSHAAAANNLPVEVSSFIGRDGDISRGVALLAETRLLTLTGAGGCGKTRLAQRIAGRVLHRYPGGIWWTELARLTNEGLIADEVADVLGVRVPPGRDAVDMLSAYLGTEPALRRHRQLRASHRRRGRVRAAPPAVDTGNGHSGYQPRAARH